MSSYTYSAPPTSPTFGFFPSGVTSPNAFPTFHQSPRDSHSMFSAAFSPSTSYPNQTNGQSQQVQGSQNPLKKFVSRKWYIHIHTSYRILSVCRGSGHHEREARFTIMRTYDLSCRRLCHHYLHDLGSFAPLPWRRLQKGIYVAACNAGFWFEKGDVYLMRTHFNLCWTHSATFTVYIAFTKLHLHHVLITLHRIVRLYLCIILWFFICNFEDLRPSCFLRHPY